MRLLYVVNIPRFFVTHRLPLALAAREAGYEVHVASAMNDADNIARIEAENLPFHPLPLHQHGTRPWHELGTFNAIRQLYRELQPDLVHHVTIKAVLYGGIAARLTGVPAVVHALSGLGYVFTARGLRPRLIRSAVSPFLWFALNHPNSLSIFQNPDDRAALIRAHLISAGRSVLIKGSGVDMQRFYPQPEAEGLPVVLFAGRLMWQKGIGQFVDAAHLLRGKARFVIAGIAEADNPSAVPQRQLEAWQQEGLIEWWGQRDDMPEVFAQSHIVCLPSTYGEGVPKVLIEAAACGRAIVTTDIPGCREIAHQGHNALLVKPDDLADLAAALQSLIDEPATRQRYGAVGRALAEREFSLAQVNRETLALYESLLASRSTS